MVATEAQARVNFYLGVCLALVCAAMLILNLTRGDFILSGALGLLVLVVVIDLCAFVKKKRLPISIPMVLFLLGAVIVLSVWRAGAEVGFYAFPTLIGVFLVQPGRFAVWYSLGLTIAVAGTVATVGADAPMAIRLGLALLLCLTFLWFAAKRITEAQDQLENSVFLDPLTGCFNRRHLARVSETQDLRTAALILFDLDYFKSVNDTFGHPTGDFVLRSVTALVRQQLSDGDLFFRIGGEEFLVLRLSPEKGTTRALAEQCRQALDTSRILATRRVTATFSCADFDGRAEMEPVLGQADVALLKAKRAGRNRVV